MSVSLYFNKPPGNKVRIERSFDAFNNFKTDKNDARKDLDGFIILLEDVNINSDDALFYKKRKLLKSIFNKLTGILLIITAAWLIFLPQPKEIEILTIYYFNPNDGITISDLLALIFLVIGIAFISRK